MVGLCWGPPQPKLRFMVGEKQSKKTKLGENRVYLSLDIGGPTVCLKVVYKSLRTTKSIPAQPITNMAFEADHEEFAQT